MLLYLVQVVITIGFVFSVRDLFNGRLYLSTYYILNYLLASLTLIVIENQSAVTRRVFDFSVFNERNLIDAYFICAICLFFAAVVKLLSNKRSNSQFLNFGNYLSAARVQFFADLSRIVLALSTVLWVAISIFDANALKAPYPFFKYMQVFPDELYKLMFVLPLCAYIFLEYGQKVKTRSPSIFQSLQFWIVFSLSLLSFGGRGFHFVVVFILLILTFRAERSSYSRNTRIILYLIAFVFLYEIWPITRFVLSDGGFFSAFSVYFNGSKSFSNVAFDLHEINMFGQSLFHLLYVVELVNNNNILNGMSFLNLIPQSLPGFLDGIVFDRPLNDAVRLQSIYWNGGGFWLLANVYWNGWLSFILFCLIAPLIFYFFDNKFVAASSSFFSIFYLIFYPVFFVQIAYGLQGFARVLEVLALVYVLGKVKWYR